ncbi:MAG TPA: Dyp-type peroxidase [Thermoleophilaceae bacterium]
MGGLTRRRLIGSAGAGAVGVAATGTAYRLASGDAAAAGGGSVPFHGERQAGIATPSQSSLQFAAFDLEADAAADLRELLREWTRASEGLTRGDPASAEGPPGAAPRDPGEARGLPPASLTLTFGFGPELFERDGRDRLGLRAARPRALKPLDPFPGDALEPSRSGGDLCVQACADDPQVAFHAIHALARAGHGAVVPRWLQAGFRGRPGSGGGRPRNLFGFGDGTRNVRGSDEAAMREHVWVGGDGEPAWMTNGTYLVTRRIRMLFDVWDSTSLAGQERAVGRRKASGAELGPLPSSHVGVASADANGGRRILRRSYSFSDGVEAGAGEIEAGLFFACFQRDPHRQFGSIQRRLTEHDALAKHVLHTGSAVFACPPGTRPGGYVGEGLFSAAGARRAP